MGFWGFGVLGFWGFGACQLFSIRRCGFAKRLTNLTQTRRILDSAKPPHVVKSKKTRYETYMSQGSAMGVRVRAFFVLAAICAVTVGLLGPAFSGPASAARGAAVECPHHMAKAPSRRHPKRPAPRRRPATREFPVVPTVAWPSVWGWDGRAPFRSASLARPERRIASRIRYADYEASAIKPAAAPAANGARAPPAA